METKTEISPGNVNGAPSAAAGGEVVDVLLLQLGTPAAPTAAALRPYLREFLGDGRVLEMPRWLRWILVNLVIVPFRAPKSAAKYANIWDPKEGSPLLSITRKQTKLLAEALGPGYRVNFGMRYGEPSIPSLVRKLAEAGCRKLVVIPMFPQYSGTTTASGLDALFDALKQERIIPSIRVVSEYHDYPEYIEAVAATIERRLDEARSQGHEPDAKIISFHGIPIDYIKRGDPYMRQSSATAKLVAKKLGWKKGEYRITFQSRFGKQKWLLPYFDETIKELGAKGAKSVLVAQPGFTADCLETIDEIGREGKEDFEGAGGEHLIRVECLNDAPEFIAALASLARREARGWR
ncbi:MAG TPA: ferrochelatase [Planctomycetia bacterium]|nr:ferrochelatase [Planctomycetia bacterium]